MSKVGPKSGESDLGMQPISTYPALIATQSADFRLKTRAMVQSCHSLAAKQPRRRLSQPAIRAALRCCVYRAKSLGRLNVLRYTSQDIHQRGGAVLQGLAKITIIAVAGLSLVGCGNTGGGGLALGQAGRTGVAAEAAAIQAGRDPSAPRSTVWDLFSNADNPNKIVNVNKYIWNAALDVLNFLPIESVDPFTGVIVTGYGVPPGGGRSYRATILVQDPALDARSLKLSLQTKGGGAVAPATLRAVEDAILSRARQLRIADSKL